jgi:hypothetical protein
VVSLRLTMDIFRVLTKDETSTTLSPVSVLDYLNLH